MVVLKIVYYYIIMQVLYSAVYKNKALFKTVNQEDIVPTCVMLYS